MKRREFFTLLGGATACPFAARAQQSDRMRRIGLLIPYAESDAIRRPVSGFSSRRCSNWAGPPAQHPARLSLGRWRPRPCTQPCERARPVGPRRDRRSEYSPVRALAQETRTIPIVFIQVTDPVRAGFVASMARPGGNVTGLSMYEPAMGAKWLEVPRRSPPASRGLRSCSTRKRPPVAGGFS